MTTKVVCQVKVFTAPDFMKLSVQQFLGKSEASINSTLLHTLEGHFRCFNSYFFCSSIGVDLYILKTYADNHCRAILSTLTVEEINGDRIKFAKLVSEMASPDLGRSTTSSVFIDHCYEITIRMGIVILSFTIKDVHDNVDHLESLGKARTAEVK